MKARRTYIGVKYQGKITYIYQIPQERREKQIQQEIRHNTPKKGGLQNMLLLSDLYKLHVYSCKPC